MPAVAALALAASFASGASFDVFADLDADFAFGATETFCVALTETGEGDLTPPSLTSADFAADAAADFLIGAINGAAFEAAELFVAAGTSDSEYDSQLPLSLPSASGYEVAFAAGDAFDDAAEDSVASAAFAAVAVADFGASVVEDFAAEPFAAGATDLFGGVSDSE